MSEYRILAPVNSLAAAKVILDVGADIIYAGIKGWSLRPDIFEVPEKDVYRILDYTEKKGRQLFLAFNCFYRSSELGDVKRIIERFIRKGVSGIILSDIGLIASVRKHFPDIPIHVSVQSSASSSIDVDFYKKIGATAVVLPRDKIDLGRKNLASMAGRGLDLEVFVVGDDSTNYDGRCVLSGYMYQAYKKGQFGREHMVTGNANRCGYCYQPCKRECHVNDEKGYFLKRGDLSLHRLVPQLINAGVRNFKIQGREFPPRLIANMIYAFRNLLDNMDNQEKFEEYSQVMDDIVDLKQVIAGNHLWLLSKSESSFWKGIRKYMEKPWDDITTDFWFRSEDLKAMMKKARGIT